MDSVSLLWWLLREKRRWQTRRWGTHISPRIASCGELCSMGEHKYSTGCGPGKGKSGNSESKLETALVLFGAGFILTTVYELYSCVCACVCTSGNTGYFNMQLLFSESSLCNQLSVGGVSLVEQIPRKLLQGNALPGLGWSEKTQLCRCSDPPPSGQKETERECAPLWTERWRGASTLTVWPLAVRMDWELHP